MIQKLIYIISFISLLSLSVHAQKLKFSEELYVRNDQFLDLIGTINDTTYVLRQRQDGNFLLQSYNEDLRIIWDKKIVFEHKRAKVVTTIATDNKFTVFYRFSKQGSGMLKAMQFNEQGTPTDTFLIRKLNWNTNFTEKNLTFSQNKNVVLAQTVDASGHLHVTAFDLTSHKKIFGSSIKRDEVNLRDHILDILVENSGEAYFIYKNRNRKSKAENNSFFVLKCTKEENSDFIIPFEGKLWYDVAFSFDNLNGQLIGGGFYSDKNLLSATGLFFLKAPADNPKKSELYFEAFSNEFLSSVTGKSAKKHRGIVQDILVQELVLRRDGGILLVAEQERKYVRQQYTSTTYAGGSASKYSTDYHFDDIMVVSIHPNGKIHWKEMLRKRQLSQNDDGLFSSFFLMKTPSNLRFIYNDNIKTNAPLNEYILKGNGRHKRKFIERTDSHKVMIQFQNALQISPNQLLAPSIHKGYLKLVRFTY